MNVVNSMAAMASTSTYFLHKLPFLTGATCYSYDELHASSKRKGFNPQEIERCLEKFLEKYGVGREDTDKKAKHFAVYIEEAHAWWETQYEKYWDHTNDFAKYYEYVAGWKVMLDTLRESTGEACNIWQEPIIVYTASTDSD